MKLWKKVGIVGLGLATGLALAACGAGESSSSAEENMFQKS